MDAEARRCSASRRDGSPCTGRALPSPDEQFCFAHSPSRQEALKASRAAGGKARATRERASKALPRHLQELQDRLVQLVAEVLAGQVQPRATEVAGGLVGRLLDLAHFAHELGAAAELQQRIEALEAELEAMPAGRRRVGP